MLPRYAVQRPPSQEEMSEVILDVYEALYHSYFAHRTEIPNGQLAEVGYEAFVQESLPELERIYDALSLEGFDGCRERFAGYIASQSHIRARRYELSREQKERVAWGGASPSRNWDTTPKIFDMSYPSTAFAGNGNAPRFHERRPAAPRPP